MKEANHEVEMPRMIKMEPFEYPDISPPTLISTNEFTEVFQEITDTYGVPNFKEINPSIFACVTFPFLFGVMFGDICHGLCFVIIGSFLCLAEPWLRKKGFEAALKVRYLLLLMGIFATFCGLMYNDFASIPFFLQTCYGYDA